MISTPQEGPYSTFLIRNGNLCNGGSIIVPQHIEGNQKHQQTAHCASASTYRQMKSTGGRKQAYTAEQFPPSANKRSPTTQLGSHTQRNEGGGDCLSGEKTVEKAEISLWGRHMLA